MCVCLSMCMHLTIIVKAIIVVVVVVLVTAAIVIMCCNYMTLDAKQFVTNFTLWYQKLIRIQTYLVTYTYTHTYKDIYKILLFTFVFIYVCKRAIMHTVNDKMFRQLKFMFKTICLKMLETF